MAKDVVCSVDSCNFWGQGNKCQAESIMVNNVRPMEHAHRSDETNCETFEPNDL